MRYIVQSAEVHNFRFCPYCGSNSLTIYIGDYMGQTECLDCDEEMEIIILEEVRDRFPEKFKRFLSGSKGFYNSRSEW